MILNGLPERGFPFVIISHKIRRASDNVCVDILLINIVSSCPGLVKKKLGKRGVEWRDACSVIDRKWDIKDRVQATQKMLDLSRMQTQDGL